MEKKFPAVDRRHAPSSEGTRDEGRKRQLSRRGKRGGLRSDKAREEGGKKGEGGEGRGWMDGAGRAKSGFDQSRMVW